MKIIYQDNNVLVIDKPAGIAVHPANGIPNGETIIEQLKKLGQDTYLVHRLDKETSGVMIFAKNVLAKVFLQQQFKNRSVKKTYIALVVGKPKHFEAILTYPVARHPKNPLKRAVRGSGKPAETRYKTLKSYNAATLLEAKPTTGRTHQIRVHLAHMGNPIVGDSLYGTADVDLGRQFLHAAKLEIALPSGESKVFESPLPKDLKDYQNNLV